MAGPSMIDPRHPIAKLARKDGRYHVDAYAFVFDALALINRLKELAQSARDGLKKLES